MVKPYVRVHEHTTIMGGARETCMLVYYSIIVVIDNHTWNGVSTLSVEILFSLIAWFCSKYNMSTIHYTNDVGKSMGFLNREFDGFLFRCFRPTYNIDSFQVIKEQLLRVLWTLIERQWRYEMMPQHLSSGHHFHRLRTWIKKLRIAALDRIEQKC